jgi:hypothetical protein
LKKKDYNYAITDSPPLSVIQQFLDVIYHVRHRYLLYLDHQCLDGEGQIGMSTLIGFIMDNVNVMGKENFINYMGSTEIAFVLHVVAIFLG